MVVPKDTGMETWPQENLPKEPEPEQYEEEIQAYSRNGRKPHGVLKVGEGNILSDLQEPVNKINKHGQEEELKKHGLLHGKIMEVIEKVTCISQCKK